MGTAAAQGTCHERTAPAPYRVSRTLTSATIHCCVHLSSPLLQPSVGASEGSRLFPAPFHGGSIDLPTIACAVPLRFGHAPPGSFRIRFGVLRV